MRFHCGEVLARILVASEVPSSLLPFWINECFFPDCSEFGTPYLNRWHVVCFVRCHVVLFCFVPVLVSRGTFDRLLSENVFLFRCYQQSHSF